MATAALGAACRACAASLSPGARFCHRCGRAVSGKTSERPAWITAWSIIAVLLALILWHVETRGAGGERPVMANVGSSPSAAPPSGAAAPDISRMSPRERFLRLSDRVLSAAEAGDTAAVQRFAPMALAAYGMLDTVDVDSRYHAAMVALETGQPALALALADTIHAEARNHLFGYLIQSRAAEARNDRAALARARRAFLANYGAELRKDRPEYREHLELLERARNEFSRATGASANRGKE